MLSFPDNIMSARAAILASIHVLFAQGATVNELVDGIQWARAMRIFDDPAADAMLDELVAALRAGKLFESVTPKEALSR